MNRRLKFGIVGLVALAAAGFVVFYHATRGPTEEEFETVQKGMSRDDVIAILGTPTEIEQEADRIWLHWRARDIHIVIAFGDDRVVAKTWFRLRKKQGFRESGGWLMARHSECVSSTPRLMLRTFVIVGVSERR
jgi:hypothetical protein